MIIVNHWIVELMPEYKSNLLALVYEEESKAISSFAQMRSLQVILNNLSKIKRIEYEME